MSNRTRIYFKVSFVPPAGATISEMRAYVEEAVALMKGCLKPPGVDDTDLRGDPMFDLDGDLVRVVRYRQSKRKS